MPTLKLVTIFSCIARSMDLFRMLLLWSSAFVWIEADDCKINSDSSLTIVTKRRKFNPFESQLKCFHRVNLERAQSKDFFRKWTNLENTSYWKLWSFDNHIFLRLKLIGGKSIYLTEILSRVRSRDTYLNLATSDAFVLAWNLPPCSSSYLERKIIDKATYFGLIRRLSSWLSVFQMFC